MSNFIRHPYHLVDESPWPWMMAFSSMALTCGLAKWFTHFSLSLTMLSMVCMFLTAYQWWRDVVLESSYQGLHSSLVELGMRWGMILFIISEIFFFLSFFWAYFHSSLTCSFSFGSCWPPIGISVFNCFKVPLLNTLILLSSGISVTWSHHALMNGKHSSAIISLWLTVLLGIYFSLIQALEYNESSFNLADGVYGSTFFIATGFHGLHVLVGTLFLLVTLLRIKKCHVNNYHHFGFEAASWYWHFVDVVWLFLFISIYWWGGK